jgi:molybdopterin synthase sulfur carrier subunit
MSEKPDMHVTVLYFASLRDASGCASEPVRTEAGDVASLYRELRERHGFGFAPERLRAAIDGAFVPWTTALHDGAEIAFLPPVSGG